MKLSRPIQAHGETLTELTLREPTGKDIRTAGAPYKMEFTASGGQLMHIDTEAVARLISALAGIPPSSVDQLTAKDFNAAQAEVISFFGDAVPAT